MDSSAIPLRSNSLCSERKGWAMPEVVGTGQRVYQISEGMDLLIVGCCPGVQTKIQKSLSGKMAGHRVTLARVAQRRIGVGADFLFQRTARVKSAALGAIHRRGNVAHQGALFTAPQPGCPAGGRRDPCFAIRMMRAI